MVWDLHANMLFNCHENDKRGQVCTNQYTPLLPEVGLRKWQNRKIESLKSRFYVTWKLQYVS